MVASQPPILITVCCSAESAARPAVPLPSVCVPPGLTTTGGLFQVSRQAGKVFPAVAARPVFERRRQPAFIPGLAYQRFDLGVVDFGRERGQFALQRGIVGLQGGYCGDRDEPGRVGRVHPGRQRGNVGFERGDRRERFGFCRGLLQAERGQQFFEDFVH